MDYFTVDREGALVFDDENYSDEVERVFNAIADAGFTPDEGEEYEGTGLAIQMPMMTGDEISRLEALIESKESLIKKAIGDLPNPAGLDAGLALIGEGMIIFALFNMIFFPLYYRDINKPGKAFMAASAAVFAWIILEVVGTYAIPFFRDVLDQPDPRYMSDKALFTLGGLALFLGGTAWSIQASEKRFMELDLNL